MGWIDGKFGFAGDFNGSNSIVNLGNRGVFNLNNLTAEAWVFLPQITGEESIFIKRADDDSLIYDFQIDNGEVCVFVNRKQGHLMIEKRAILDLLPELC